VKELPPTDDSFHQHLLRCVYQLSIWRNVISTNVQLPEVTECGYYIDNDIVQPVLMTQPAAAPELLNAIICNCVSCDNNCTCSNYNQSCTAACTCRAEFCYGDGNDDDICCNPFTYNALYETIDNDLSD